MSFKKLDCGNGMWTEAGPIQDGFVVYQDHGQSITLCRTEAIWLQNVLREWLCSSPTIPAPPPDPTDEDEPSVGDVETWEEVLP